MPISNQIKAALEELCVKAGLCPGQILVVGCSTSEVRGSKIGTDSAAELGMELASAALVTLVQRGIYLAAQCCEHLNRCVIVEREAVQGSDIVNVVPQPKAGGSFATAAYKLMRSPVAVEHIRADAGIDIGGTLIGMHLKEVAVPVRLSLTRIGEAGIICARVRPKFIGGSRAVYNERLL